MPKPTKADLTKLKAILEQQLAALQGDVGSLKDEALRANEQDASVDHLADMGTDNYDQAFMLSMIENEEETIGFIQEALERIDGEGEWPFGACPRCMEEAENGEIKKSEVWIPKARLEYIPWARYCVRHQEELESRGEVA